MTQSGAEVGRLQTAEEMYQAWLDRATVGEFITGGNTILLHCRACGYGVDCGAALDRDALEKLPAALTLRGLAERARFKCGAKGAWVDSRRDPRAVPKPPEP